MTKSQRLAKQLRGEILSGRWSPQGRIPGEYELQARFGVSRITVRDALATLANEGLIIRKQGDGTYVAERNARSCVLITVEAGRLSSLNGYWFRSMVEEAQSQITDAGFRAVLALAHGESDDEFMSSVNVSIDASQGEVVGVFDLIWRKALQDYLTSSGIPFVRVDPGVPVSTYSVVLDYASLVRIAVGELLKFGYNDFVLMHYRFSEKELENPTWREHARLIEAAVSNRSDRLSLVRHLDPDLAYAAFKELWARKDRPRAIFFYDDSLFDVASRAILELGIQVPEELAIITHANVGRRIHFPTRLARIGFDPVTVVTEAWGLLKKIINCEPVFNAVIAVPPVYDRGESLCKAASEDRSPDARMLV